MVTLTFAVQVIIYINPVMFVAAEQQQDSVVCGHAVRCGVVLGCALDFPQPLGGLRSLGGKVVV